MSSWSVIDGEQEAAGARRRPREQFPDEDSFEERELTAVAEVASGHGESGSGTLRHPAAAGEELPCRGSLLDYPFATLLLRLHRLRATGTLLLAAGKKRKAVELRDGCPVKVKSNLVNECFGNQLLRRGLIANDDFEKSLARVKRGDGRHGEILVTMDLLSEGMVGQALNEQAEEKLFEIFGWVDGGFKFKRGARINRGNKLALTRTAAGLIVEGARRRIPILLVDAFIDQNRDSYAIAGEGLVQRFQEVGVTPKEAEFLCLVDGTRKLSCFRTVDQSMRRVLYGLILTDVIELRDVPAAGAARADRRPAPALRMSAKPDDLPLHGELAAMVDRLCAETYFEMLGVSSDADAVEVREAYAERAGRLHPDRFRSAHSSLQNLAAEAFQILSHARRVLLDPKRRGEYVLELRKNERLAAAQIESERVATAALAFREGEAKLRRRVYKDALRLFGKALELNASQGEYHAHYGWCLFLCHQENEVMIEEAIEHVRRGAKLAGDQEKPYLFLGRLYKVSGRTGAAEKMFSRAVQIQPDCVDAVRELRLINTRREKNKSLLSRFLPVRRRGED